MNTCSNCGKEFKPNVGHVKITDGKCKERKFYQPEGKK